VDDVIPYETPFSEKLVVGRWSRPSRFLFIVGAAILCWVGPSLAVYLLITPD
jgi:hypothetical protein